MTPDTAAAVPTPDITPEIVKDGVLILGGGLAGLTLSLQLKQRFPDLPVQVLERKAHPLPLAAHKVGESSVEIGAHYFSKVLGLEEHLQAHQLRKFGYRFFFSEGRRDIDQVTEVGFSRYTAVPSYQLDRGSFENFLGEEALRLGVRFVDQAVVRKVELANVSIDPEALHEVTWEHAGAMHRSQVRWVVDAAGRASLLKRQLGLAEPNAHTAHAVWFRIHDHLPVDQWTENPEWTEICSPPARWRSTNHLVGAGYWVWLIPLSSGSHSVGIVADPAIHPLETMNTFEKAMDWLKTFQPRVFEEVDRRRELLQDFMFFRRFSYGCKQVYSDQRWALTGEAGLFLDPFYSPGSDYIAMSNTFVTDLISRDRLGQRWAVQAQLYDQLYHSFYENTLALYTDQYPLFADAEVMPVKVLWDYSFYWGVLAQIFFQKRLTDLAMISRLRDELDHCGALNRGVQAFLRGWSQSSAKRNPAHMFDQTQLAWFSALNKSLNDPRDNDDAFVLRIRQSTMQLRALARQIILRAQGDHPGLDASELQALLDGHALAQVANRWDAETLLMPVPAAEAEVA